MIRGLADNQILPRTAGQVKETTEEGSDTSSQPAAQGMRKRRKKLTKIKDPEPESDSDGKKDEGAPRIKNPPSSRTILRKFFSYNIVKIEGREVIYWEWKAG